MTPIKTSLEKCDGHETEDNLETTKKELAFASSFL
jgi:hypothetical protein